MLVMGLWVYQQELTILKQQSLTHPLCKDTKSYTAWLARKDGEFRCFLEHNEYPHRAKGSNIDYTEDIPVSGG